MTLTLAVALVAGLLVGASLGAVGAGGSILAVPLLVYGLGQDPLAATTGSLVVVGATAVVGAVAAARSGASLPLQGLGFGTVALGGAWLGARASVRVPETVLLAAFSALMLLAGALMVRRQLSRRAGGDPASLEPVLTLRPELGCACPRLVKVVVTASAVGLVTGFLGVGGGFLVVPALVLALGIPLHHAVGTSLVVIAMTSAGALATRVGLGVTPDWTLVAVLTASAVAGTLPAARLARRVDPRPLGLAFAALVLVVATGTAWQSLPALA